MKNLNLRLIGILSGIVLVLVPAAYFFHGYQTQRNAGAYLREARRAQDENRPQDALAHLRRYVKLAPADTEGLALYAIQMADLGQLRPAYLLLGQAIRRDPTHEDWRRRNVEIAIGLGRFSDARTTLQNDLLKKSPKDSALLVQLGLCHAGLGEDDAAARCFERAIAASPEQLENYAVLAELLRTRLKDARKAEQTLDRMVSANPKNHKAFLVRGQWHLARSGQVSTRAVQSLDESDRPSSLERASQDAEQAIKLAPDAPEAVLFAATVALHRKELEVARKRARRALELDTSSSKAYSVLADIETSSGDSAAAAEWLRRGTVALPNDTDLRWNLANLLLDQGQTSEAEKETAKLHGSSHPTAPVQYLDARLAMTSGEWLKAARQFETVRPELDRWPTLQKQADFYTGSCRHQLGNVDQQLAAYRRALAVDPTWVPARLGVADALLALGRIQEAEEQYRQIAAQPDSPLVAPLKLAQVLLISNLRKDAADRSWNALESLLSQIEKAQPDLPQVVLLRAEVLLAQDRAEAAKQLIADARTKDPKSLELLAADVTLAQQARNWSEVAKLLAESESQIEDRTGHHLLAARALALQHGEKAGPELKKLWDDFSPDLSADEKSRLAEGIASLALAVGDLGLAAEVGAAAAQLDRSNLQIRLLLLDIGFRLRREDFVKRVLGELKEIEGEGPLWHYGEALRLVTTAKDGRSPSLVEAQNHLTTAKVARPGWSRIPLLSAEISALQGAKDRATEAYLEAISLGERRSAVVGRAVALLFEQKRFVEADQVIRRLQEQQTVFTGDLSRIAAETSLQLQDYDRALDLAESVATDSERFQDHIWVGQVLAILGRLDEAEQQLRKATALAGSQPEPWIALVQVLVRAGRPKDAEQVIAEIRRSVSEDQAVATVAQCYEILGQIEAADEHYRQALQKSPEDSAIVRRAVEFYLRKQRPADAEPLLRQIIGGLGDAADAEKAWARRNLALIVSGRGASGYAEADALLDANEAQAPGSRSDARARALTLATQPSREQRRQAAELLAELLADESTASVSDRFILAELYRQDGDFAKAAAELRKIVTAQPKEPRYLATYIRVLLDRREISEAEIWIDRLKEIASDAIDTADVEARLLFERGRYQQLMDLLLAAAHSSATGDRVDRTRWAADRLESYADQLARASHVKESSALDAAARSLLEEHVRAVPADKLVLAAYLVRKGEFEAAVELVPEELADSDQKNVANLAAAAVTSGNAEPADLERLQHKLESAMKQQSSVTVELAIADLLSWRGDYAGAESKYREVLATAPSNTVALNNLAIVVGLGRGNHQEALALVDRAIETAGQAGFLIDTRGLILLAAGRTAEARRDFQQAIAESETPDRNLHLSLVLTRLGETEAAKAAFAKAYSAGLKDSQLHPLERALIRQIQLATR